MLRNWKMAYKVMLMPALPAVVFLVMVSAGCLGSQEHSPETAALGDWTARLCSPLLKRASRSQALAARRASTPKG